MNDTVVVPVFWLRWLIAATLCLMVFGLAFMFAPGLMLAFLSMVYYGSAQHMTDFGAGPAAYIMFEHGILGSVVFGWSVTLFLTVAGPFRRGEPEAWWRLVGSLTAWFVADTAYSLWTGFWQSVLLGLFFGVLFAIPLGATYRNFRAARA